MKDLIVIDKDTGSRENLGIIEDRRSIGRVRLWLTHDLERRMWWIVWNHEGGEAGECGYVEARRADCWETFYAIKTEADLACLRPS